MTAARVITDEAVAEIGTAIRRAAGRAPLKVVASRTGLSDEGARKIRDGERVQPRLRTVIEFMFADPEVADAIARYAVRALQPGFWDAK